MDTAYSCFANIKLIYKTQSHNECVNASASINCKNKLSYFRKQVSVFTLLIVCCDIYCFKMYLLKIEYVKVYRLFYLLKLNDTTKLLSIFDINIQTIF